MKTKYNPFDKFFGEWALVTAGNKDSFNSMTISWGSMGTIWRRSVISIYIRPERYTHKFLNENEYFTVSFYDEKYKDALKVMGSKSGRDCDKVKESGLTPIVLENGAITYKEAKETFLCKKIYAQDMIRENMPEDTIMFYGENGLAHTVFIGEVIKKL